VDGEQAIERQIPANERLHFSADQSVTVRAGDAGAVRLTVNGRDEGPVGGDGQVATRTIPARPAGR
jgi:hypothetical protein